MHPQNIEDDAYRIVEIGYMNHKSEYKIYKIIPHSIYFGRNEFDTHDQWLMNGTHIRKNVLKIFAMKDIDLWRRV